MNIVDVRMGNIRDILSALRFSEGMTKRDLAQVTGLSFSTVGTLCALMQEAGLLEEVEISSYRVGRSPKVIRILREKHLTICLDLQREGSFGLGILGLDNTILFLQRYDAGEAGTIEDLLRLAYQKFQEQCSCHQWMQQAVYTGVGIAVSGVFDKESRQIVNSTIAVLENALVTDTAEQIFGLPCYTDNEANLCAIAMSQSKSNAQNLIYLHLSQGAGVGIICEGGLLRGNRGYAAEISHMPLGTAFKRCPSCGNYGCVESEICLRGMVEGFGLIFGPASYLERWQQVVAEIQTKQDKVVRQYLRNKGEMIGKVLSILVNLFDPQEIFIGGEVSDIFEQLEPTITDVLQKRCAVFQKTPIPLLCDKDSEKSILLGLNQMLYERWNPIAT